MLEELQTVLSYLGYFIDSLQTRDKISLILFTIAGCILAWVIIDVLGGGIDDEEF